jgi:hypothetical protein
MANVKRGKFPEKTLTILATTTARRISFRNRSICAHEALIVAGETSAAFV